MKSYTRNIWELLLFPLIIIFIWLIHFYLLKPALSVGFETDDWNYLLYYKALGDNPLSKIIEIWVNGMGIYKTMSVYWVGTLFDILGFDYPKFNLLNIFFKFLASVSVYPMVLIIFKRRLLALLATLIYAISWGATGGLTYVSRGADYVAIIFMNLFFICYYFTISKRSKLWLFLSIIAILVSFFFAPIRIYPVVGVVLLTELLLNFKLVSKTVFKFSLQRTLALILPLVALILTSRIHSEVGTPYLTFRKLMDGNWHMMLEPLSGIGYLFLTNKQYLFLGSMDPHNFMEYFTFLMEKVLLLFVPLTIILSLLLAKKFWRFFFVILFTNLFFDILIYFISVHFLSIPKSLQIGYDPAVYWFQKYSVLLGVYSIIIALASLFKWLKEDNKNRVLLALFFGPIFAAIFLYGLWVVLGGLNIYGGINRYFQLPALGIALFIGGLLTLMYDKWSKGKIVTVPFIAFVLVSIFIISSQEIDLAFNQVSSRNSYLHQSFQNTFMDKIEGVNNQRVILFYFEIPDESRKVYYEQAVDLYNLPQLMNIRLGIKERCVGRIYDKKILKKAIEGKGKYKFVNDSTLCLEKNIDNYKAVENVFERRLSSLNSKTIPYNISTAKVGFGIENFYAFQIDGDKFIDITQQIIKEYGLE